ncbi:MAG: DUF4336 domain-containing protein [Alteromonadaceae bacterium]|nr:DUF4336 domain-containing protein [Alteromonadaceae bacterium]
MKKLTNELWIFDGDSVQFLGLPFSTRMTVIRLEGDELWVHSPIKLSSTIKEQLENLGRVKYLVAPNHLHHLFLPEWTIAYPNAEVYGTDEVIKKRSDITFTASLNQVQEWPWGANIDQVLFSGSPLMEECVFFHKDSGTLIVTDLVENFSGKEFSGWQRAIAKIVGILAPHGKTPLDWRLSFLFKKSDARKHIQKIVAWEPNILVMAHGEIVTKDTKEFLAKSFSWLL